MIRIVFTLTILFACNVLYAQVRATTESGNKVILFDNGTWKYEEKKMTTTAEPETKVNDVPVQDAEQKPTPIATLKVDKNKDVESHFEILYFTTSKRLERFFGEENSKTRCKASCSNKNGEVRIHFIWEFPVGDGNRYYGYLKEGSRVTLHLSNGQKLQLALSEKGTWETREEYNFSAFKGQTKQLSHDQLQLLSSLPTVKIEVDWKKNSETYQLDDSSYFVKTLAQVL